MGVKFLYGKLRNTVTGQIRSGVFADPPGHQRVKQIVNVLNLSLGPKNLPWGNFMSRNNDFHWYQKDPVPRGLNIF